MQRLLLTLSMMAAVSVLHAGEPPPAFNNWTTQSLKQIFIPPTRITRVHGKIKTVTFLYPPNPDGYLADVNAYQLFHLIFLFLFGPDIDHKYILENDDTPGVIRVLNRETGYVVTRDRDFGPNDKWRYHFTATKNDATILTAELIPSEKLGPRLILHIKD